MFLISNLYGPFDNQTSKGRGRNAAYNVVKFYDEGKKILVENHQKYENGEISLLEKNRNSAIEKLSECYITYAEVDTELGLIDYDYGLSYTIGYIESLDCLKQCYLEPEFIPCGEIIDKIDNSGKITADKLLAWLIYQDSKGIINGVISPDNAGQAVMDVMEKPDTVVENLKEIYKKYNIKTKYEEFRMQHTNSQ